MKRRAVLDPDHSASAALCHVPDGQAASAGSMQNASDPRPGGAHHAHGAAASHGAILALDAGHLYGWVRPTHGSSPPTLDILADGVPVAHAAADLSPRALGSLTGGAALPDHAWGFAVPLPADILKTAHLIEARIANTALWLSGPCTLDLAPALRWTGGLLGHIAFDGAARLTGWALDPSRPNAALALDLFIDGRFEGRLIADRHEPWLAKRGIGSGFHGFLIDLPAPILDGAPHQIALETAPSGAEMPHIEEAPTATALSVPGSPLEIRAWPSALSDRLPPGPTRRIAAWYEERLGRTLPAAVAGELAGHRPAVPPPGRARIRATAATPTSAQDRPTPTIAPAHAAPNRLDIAAQSYPAHLGPDPAEIVVHLHPDLRLTPDAFAALARAFRDPACHLAVADWIVEEPACLTSAAPVDPLRWWARGLPPILAWRRSISSLRGTPGLAAAPLSENPAAFALAFPEACRAIPIPLGRMPASAALQAAPPPNPAMLTRAPWPETEPLAAAESGSGQPRPTIPQARPFDAGPGTDPTRSAPDARRAAPDGPIGALSGSTPGERTALTRPALRKLRPAKRRGGRVSIVIPTRDRADLLSRCLESIVDTDQPHEIVIVDNGSVEPATQALYDTVRAERRARILHDDAPFNFSDLCNAGAAAAEGDTLLFLNNDVVFPQPGWIGQLVSWLTLPSVGAVGCKLVWPNEVVQHGGVRIGPHGLAEHIGTTWWRDEPGPDWANAIPRFADAVTAACLAVPRALFDGIGGFDGHRYAVAFNDVDLCLRIQAAGRRIVWTPEPWAYHLESASRGDDDLPHKRARMAREEGHLREAVAAWRAQQAPPADLAPYCALPLLQDSCVPNAIDRSAIARDSAEEPRSGAAEACRRPTTAGPPSGEASDGPGPSETPPQRPRAGAPEDTAPPPGPCHRGDPHLSAPSGSPPPDADGPCSALGGSASPVSAHPQSRAPLSAMSPASVPPEGRIGGTARARAATPSPAPLDASPTQRRPAP